jgi:hypothetical protein
MGRGGVAAGEAELDGAERDNERAEECRDVGLAQHGRGGGPGAEAALSRPHPVPAPGVEQQWPLQQHAVVVAAAVVTAPAPAASHGALLLANTTSLQDWTFLLRVMGGREEEERGTTRMRMSVSGDPAVPLNGEREVGGRGLDVGPTSQGPEQFAELSRTGVPLLKLPFFALYLQDHQWINLLCFFILVICGYCPMPFVD